MEILQFVNEHLVKAVNWQDHPDIWHDEVKLGGELSVFYPSWAEELTIPNQASSDDIKVLAADHYNKYCGG
jgi:DNA polymerase-1